jgi:hypothetical protein
MHGMSMYRVTYTVHTYMYRDVLQTHLLHLHGYFLRLSQSFLDAPLEPWLGEHRQQLMQVGVVKQSLQVFLCTAIRDWGAVQVQVQLSRPNTKNDSLSLL